MSKEFTIRAALIIAAAMVPGLAFGAPCAKPIANSNVDDFHGLIQAAAYIKHDYPNPGWVPISQRPASWGISDATINRLMMAGGEFLCSYPSQSASGAPTTVVRFSNAWFLEDSTKYLNTNAHAVIDDNGDLRNHLDTCNFTLFKDLIGAKEPAQYPIDADPRNYILATADPSRDDVQQDRAKIPLGPKVDGVAGAVPLQVKAIASSTIAVHEGDTVYVITTGRLFNGQALAKHVEPMIEQCRVRVKAESWNGEPGGMYTDCDGLRGVSSGLFLVADKIHPGNLIPIGVDEGVNETVVDHKAVDGLPWNREHNSDIAISLDKQFFDMSTAVAVGTLSSLPTATHEVSIGTVSN